MSFNGTIEILLATYNGEEYIAEQLSSLMSQTYEKWILLVSDDCSTDATVSIVQGYSNLYQRISLLSKNRRYGSAKDNFIALLKASEAPYVMFCDQDDVWLPEKIEVTYDKMREQEARYGTDCPILVCSDMAVVDGSLNLIDGSFARYCGIDPRRSSLSKLFEQNIAAGCTMMLNKPLVDLAKSLLETSRIEHHDWWVVLVASAFGAITYIDTPLSLYRQHGANVVGASRYSPLGPTTSMSNRERCFRARIAQAEFFFDLYGGHMSDEVRGGITPRSKAMQRMFMRIIICSNRAASSKVYAGSSASLKRQGRWSRRISGLAFAACHQVSPCFQMDERANRLLLEIAGNSAKRSFEY